MIKSYIAWNDLAFSAQLKNAHSLFMDVWDNCWLEKQKVISSFLAVKVTHMPVTEDKQKKFKSVFSQKSTIWYGALYKYVDSIKTVYKKLKSNVK